MKILVFGLPSSGKTTFSKLLQQHLNDCIHLNADHVRECYNDWDFSLAGRINQAKRMHHLANQNNNAFIICDFVCPIAMIRDSLFIDYYKIYIDTIECSAYHDTNAMFERPHQHTFDFIITNKNNFAEYADKLACAIASIKTK